MQGWLITSHLTYTMADNSYFQFIDNDNIDGLLQEIHNPSVLAMELRLSCNNPSISSTHILTIFTREMRMLKIYSSIYCRKIHWEHGLNNWLLDNSYWFGFRSTHQRGMSLNRKESIIRFVFDIRQTLSIVQLMTLFVYDHYCLKNT